MRKRILFVLVVLLIAFLCAFPAAQAQDTIITNLADLARVAFSDDQCLYLPSMPWQWQAYSNDGGVPWWLDCSRLSCGDLLQGPTNLTRGVPSFGALLTKNILTGETTVQPGGSTDIVARIGPPGDYQTSQLSSQDVWVWREWLQATNCSDCWGIEGEFPPPTVTLKVLLADISDYATYESNVNAEAEMEGEAPAEPQETTFSSGGMMMMDGSDPCVVTNETAPFVVLSVTYSANGAEVVFESCSDHLYEVQSADDLSTQTTWTVQALMIGDDGSTSWADTNAPSYDHRFYRVQRYAFWDDADGDGLANIDEFNLGTDMHNPDTDGDGILDGDDPNPLDPTVGPASTNGFVRLYNAFGIYTNTTQIYLQANARSTNAAVTVTRAEYFDTIVSTNGGGVAMSALDGAFNSTNEVAIANFTPSFTNGQHRVYWLHARGSDGQWSPYVKVIINPNVNDILNKIQANYSAMQDLQFTMTTTETQNGTVESTNSYSVWVKGPYKTRSQYADGSVSIRNENEYGWYNLTQGVGDVFQQGLNGDFSTQGSRSSDFFWDVPLATTRTDPSISNSVNSATFSLGFTPKLNVSWFVEHATVDHTKGFVTEIDMTVEDVTTTSEYLNPVEILPGRWMFTTHRYTITFGTGDNIITESTITNLQANQGLADSLFTFPTQ